MHYGGGTGCGGGETHQLAVVETFPMEAGPKTGTIAIAEPDCMSPTAQITYSGSSLADGGTPHLDARLGSVIFSSVTSSSTPSAQGSFQATFYLPDAGQSSLSGTFDVPSDEFCMPQQASAAGPWDA